MFTDVYDCQMRCGTVNCKYLGCIRKFNQCMVELSDYQNFLKNNNQKCKHVDKGRETIFWAGIKRQI